MPQDPAAAPVTLVDTGSDRDILDAPQDRIAFFLSGVPRQDFAVGIGHFVRDRSAQPFTSDLCDVDRGYRPVPPLNGACPLRNVVVHFTLFQC
jgi:hypothetical protein